MTYEISAVFAVVSARLRCDADRSSDGAREPASVTRIRSAGTSRAFQRLGSVPACSVQTRERRFALLTRRPRYPGGLVGCRACPRQAATEMKSGNAVAKGLYHSEEVRRIAPAT